MHARGTLINLWASQFFFGQVFLEFTCPIVVKNFFVAPCMNMSCIFFDFHPYSPSLSPGGPSAGHPRAGPPVRLHRAGGVHLELPARHPQHPQRLPHLRRGQPLLPGLPQGDLLPVHGSVCHRGHAQRHLPHSIKGKCMCVVSFI